jgi:hypothetical protein
MAVIFSVGVDRLLPGSTVEVRRVKPGRRDVVYPMTVELDDGDHVVVSGPFSGSVPVDLGYVWFEPEDGFVEHFWRTRWYSVADVRHPVRGRKGWYCDVTRPAEVSPGSVASVDLDLDLWVPAGPGSVLVLDEDEFAASGLARTDPAAASQARRALDELQEASLDRFGRLLA